MIHVKWGVSGRWSFGPNSAWGSIETTKIKKNTLFAQNIDGRPHKRI